MKNVQYFFQRHLTDMYQVTNFQSQAFSQISSTEIDLNISNSSPTQAIRMKFKPDVADSVGKTL